MSYELKNTFASLPATTRGYPMVLGGDPKGKNFLYCNDKYVFIRDIENADVSDVYAEHQYPANVAKYSPSGFYIASGDTTGKVRIWDTINPEHILKSEYQPISGPIKDIAWSPDNQRMVVGGDGREKYGHVFLADSGSSVGEITGHIKAINSVDFKPTRPYRIVSGSEDFAVAFYEGPPFKYKQLSKVHSRFVQTVRYSPDGKYVATGSADGKVVIHDAKDYTVIVELGEAGKAHQGGIYAVSWSPDSKELLSASGDKSAKVWNIEEKSCTATFRMGTTIFDQQVGCLWQGDNLLTVSLSGYITYLDKKNPEKPLRTIKGHNKLITSMIVSEDQQTIYTASSDGRVISWNAADGVSKSIDGPCHSNQVNGMTVVGDQVASIGMDDKLRFFNVADNTYTDEDRSVGSQPKSITSSHGGLIVIGCIDKVQIFRSGNRGPKFDTQYEARSVAIHPNHQQVAVGANDNRIYICSLDSSDNLEEVKSISTSDTVGSLKYSPDGKFLCVGFGKAISMYDVEEDYKKVETAWQSHTASINHVAFSPDGLYIASCSLDTSIIIWSVEDKSKVIKMLRAHPRANIRSVKWLDNTTIVSAGDDCCVRKWSITHH